jgi:uncharacterized protein
MKTRTTLIFFAVIGILFLFRDKPCANFKEATLNTPTQELTVALADTPAKQSKGLGGCKNVPRNAGMYFAFTDEQQRIFWMKDMLTSIDIIWLKDDKVVGIEKNVSNLPPRVPDSELPTYTSPVPIDAVLEVGAGKAGEYGIEVGSELHIDKK